MPLLEQIADMAPDVMETFTPPSIGGDTDLAEAKARIGDRVCMIGGFDQAGYGGGFILSPSDHFFDADRDLIKAFVDGARARMYS